MVADPAGPVVLLAVGREPFQSLFEHDVHNPAREGEGPTASEKLLRMREAFRSARATMVAQACAYRREDARRAERRAKRAQVRGPCRRTLYPVEFCKER